MKYILKNLRSFFYDSRLIMILLIISTLVSSVIFCFSYGIYQNFVAVLELEQSAEASKDFYSEFKLTNELNKVVYSVTIPGVIDEEDIVTGYGEKDLSYKGELTECLLSIDKISDELSEKISFIDVRGILDGQSYGFTFEIENGQFLVPEVSVSNMEENGMLYGEYWTDEQERTGAKVALCFDKTKFDNQTPYLDRIREGDTLLIDGERYEIIGYQTATDEKPLIPYLSVSDDMPLISFHIGFDTPVSTKTFQRIKQILTDCFQDRIQIIDIKTIDKDSIYTYRTVLVIALCIAVIAAFNMMILYQYVLSMRNRKNAIYRICGLTSGKIMIMNYLECMLITVPVFLLGMIGYDRLILPFANQYFPYMTERFSLWIYLFFLGIYFLVSTFFVGIMIFCKNRSSIIELLKKGAKA